MLNTLPDWSKLNAQQKGEIVRPLADSGMSGGEIARHFRYATRNSVIGVCHRQGIRLEANKSLVMVASLNTDRVLALRDAHPDWTAKQASEHLGVRASVLYSIAKKLRFTWPKSVRTREPKPVKTKPGKQSKPRNKAKSSPVAPKPLPIPDTLPDVTDRIGIVEASDAKGCMWCDGDPLGAHSFCGKPRKEGTSWCEGHYARVFKTQVPA